MILAISANAQTTCLDVWETKADRFAEGRGVDVRDAILVTHSTIRKVEALAGDIAIRIWGIVSSQPSSGKGETSRRGRGHRGSPSLDKYLLCSVGCAGGGGHADICREFFEAVVWADGHPSEGACCMDGILMICRHRLGVAVHGCLIVGRAAEEHRNIVCFA